MAKKGGPAKDKVHLMLLGLLYIYHITLQLKDTTFAITMFGCGKRDKSDKLVFDILWYGVVMLCSFLYQR